MNTNYDVMILGTGEAGIYAAYELALKCPSAKVLVVDKGADIYRRSCPGAGGAEIRPSPAASPVQAPGHGEQFKNPDQHLRGHPGQTHLSV